jgi:ribosomal protein S3
VGVDRVVDKVNVRIFTGYPGLLIRNDSVYKLRDQLKQKLAKNHRVLEISLVELSKPDGNAGILAEFIGQRLEERVPFRRVAKEVLDKVGLANNSVFKHGCAKVLNSLGALGHSPGGLLLVKSCRSGEG